MRKPETKNHFANYSLFLTKPKPFSPDLIFIFLIIQLINYQSRIFSIHKVLGDLTEFTK